MILVYVVGGDHLIEEMFTNRDGFEIVNDSNESEDTDIVVFTGGHDVTPDLYGDIYHPTTSNSKFRDSKEEDIFLSLPKETLKVGICRGSQFLCVMNGGTLFQDVDNHCRTHDLIYTGEDGRDSVHKVTSTHHQMMRLLPQEYSDMLHSELWGFAAETTYRDTGKDRGRPTNLNEGPDTEILYFPKTHSLCFQGHPEYGLKSCEDLFFVCLSRALSRN